MFISQDSYKKEILLSGLLFTHRIADNRMGGSAIKYLKMFHNLCGVEALKNVVLVATMWDQVYEENQNPANRIAFKQDKARIAATLRMTNVQRKRFSVASSFRRLSSSQIGRAHV